MKSRFTDFRFWFLIFLVVVSAALVPAQTKQKQITNATLEGQVTWRGKGVAGCSVLIWDGPFSEVNVGAVRNKTDAEGYFQFPVRPGNYYVWIDAPNYYVVADGKPSLKPIQVAVEEGEKNSGLNFSLETGGVVTGKVTNAEDIGVIDIAVSLIPTQKSESTVGTTNAQWATTVSDDRGIYRLYGVPPGEYRIAVGDVSPAQNAKRGRPAVPRTFFPDSVSEAKAKAVTVAIGQEVTGIDIRLPAARPTFVVTGKVVDGTTGAPVPNISVGLTIYEGQTRIGGLGGDNATNEKGEFQVDRVPGGRYSLYVPFAQQPVENFGETEPFDVINEDVSGIVLTTSRMASVSGAVSVEGNVSTEMLRLIKSTRFIATTLPKGSGRVLGQGFTINEDLSFNVVGLLPGRLNIVFALRAGDRYPPLRVLRLEHEGRRDPVELLAGDKLNHLAIVIGPANSRVSGRVRLIEGWIANDLKGSASLYQDRLNIGWTQLDRRGKFLFENIPAGTFRLVVTVSIPGSHPLISEQNVVLTNGQVTEIDVMVDPKSTQNSKRP